MFSFLVLLAASLVTTIAARVKGQPLRPGWSFGFEVIARSLKASAARIARLDWALQRKAQEALVQPSPVLRRLKFEPATVGGVAGEWFVPFDAGDDAPVVIRKRTDRLRPGSAVALSAHSCRSKVAQQHSEADVCSRSRLMSASVARQAGGD